jgi:hypothetical protein
MDRAVDEVILAPFRDMVAYGKVAVNNAENIGNEQMLRAAQVIVKEGERALKRIEPVCQRSHYEYGPSFVDALMNNGMGHLMSCCRASNAIQC